MFTEAMNHTFTATEFLCVTNKYTQEVLFSSEIKIKKSETDVTWRSKECKIQDFHGKSPGGNTTLNISE